MNYKAHTKINFDHCECCGTALKKIPIGKESILHQCPHCNHVQRNLDQCHEMAREHAWGGNESFDTFRLNITLKRLLKIIPSKEKLNILEIGFGAGYLMKKLIEKGHTLAGIDAGLLKRDVDQSLEKSGAELFFGNAEEYDLPENAYDLIYAIHLIEHLTFPEAVFNNAYASLKPGGHVFFITPNGRSKGLSWFKEAWWNLEDPTHVRFFSPESVTLMLQKCGYENVRITRPLMDSLTLESNSLWRKISPSVKQHGVMENKLSTLVNLGSLPVMFALRLLYPAIMPSMEIYAQKPA